MLGGGVTSNLLRGFHRVYPGGDYCGLTRLVGPFVPLVPFEIALRLAQILLRLIQYTIEGVIRGEGGSCYSRNGSCHSRRVHAHGAEGGILS